MANLLLFFILITFIVLDIKFLIKKDDAVLVKICFLILSIILVTPFIIYLFDALNLASILNMNENINSEQWFNFIGNYISSVAGAIIGVGSLVVVTYLQLERTNEDNKSQKREEMIIQNMPLLRYNVIKKYKNFVLEIENVGMNTLRNGKIFDPCNHEVIDFTNNGVLLKGEGSKVAYNINQHLHKNNLTLEVYYEDLINNQYKQIITIKYKKATNEMSLITNKEILLSEENKIIF